MFWLIVAFIIQTGSKNATWGERPDSFAVWVGAVIGGAAAVITLVAIMPILRRNIQRAYDATEKMPEGISDSDALQKELQATGRGDPLLWIARKIPQGVHNNKIWRFVFWNFYQDIHSDATEDIHVKNMHDSAEVFDPKVEALFRYLQVFSASVMSFTHGANDVANAMGPFSAVYTIWSTGEITSKVSVQTWILVIGGLGLVAGIALYSSNISRCLGVRVCKVTYSRGFCAEFATATTVAIASRYGLPVSTTQTITGALIFLGLQEGFKGVNWREVLKIFTGWVLTLLFACGIAALLTALGVNSPNRDSLDDVLYARQQLLNVSSEAMLAQVAAAGATGASLGALNTANADYLAAFEPQQANLTQIVAVTQSALSVFNQTLAYNPYTSTAGSLVP
jgi:sodium-dependent phosphate transporter